MTLGVPLCRPCTAETCFETSTVLQLVATTPGSCRHGWPSLSAGYLGEALGFWGCGVWLSKSTFCEESNGFCLQALNHTSRGSRALFLGLPA